MKKVLTILFSTLMLFSSVAVAQDWGKIVSSTVGGIQQLAEASKDITPSEEHYIGRAVAAMILSKYPLSDNAALTNYVNKVGLLLANASDRPVTYGGYHFAVIKSDMPNAYACPGGIILISDALLRELANEDQLAAVLSHEVAHVAHRHGINAIKKSRWTKFGFYAAGEVGKQYTSEQTGQLAQEFQNVVMDVAKKVMESGYSKSDEKDADSSGMKFAAAAGYNPLEMIGFMRMQAEKNVGHVGGPFSSHPEPKSRISILDEVVSSLSPLSDTNNSRTARFKQHTSALHQ